RHGMGTNCRCGTNLFGNRKGTLEQLVQQRAKCARLLGSPHCVFHLPEYLGLAEHHRVKATGHPKSMAHRIVLMILVQMRLQTVGLKAVEICQPGRQMLLNLRLSRTVDFSAVTGGEYR